jgi:hypothetical protein
MHAGSYSAMDNSTSTISNSKRTDRLIGQLLAPGPRDRSADVAVQTSPPWNGSGQGDLSRWIVYGWVTARHWSAGLLPRSSVRAAIAHG